MAIVIALLNLRHEDELHLELFLHFRYQNLTISKLVTAYRQVEKLRQIELAKAQQSLAQGVNPHEVLERLSRNLTNKVMHTPSVQLKQAAASNAHDKLAWAVDLLGIQQND